MRKSDPVSVLGEEDARAVCGAFVGGAGGVQSSSKSSQICYVPKHDMLQTCQNFLRKSRGKSIQVAPHDIENPYIQLPTLMTEELRLSPISPLRCIFRVPHRLRCEREKDVHYTPQVISIGPLHHENSALKAMEEHKNRYLQYFMGRTKHLSLMHFIKKIQDQEARLRSCYSETIYTDSDEFVKIILVDAIFIIEFLYRNWLYTNWWYSELLDENDCIFGKPRMVEDVWPDLLMLENQLPFFILVDLFNPDIFPVPSEYSERLSILFLSYYFLNGVPTFGGLSDNFKTVCSSEGGCLQYSPTDISPPIRPPFLKGVLSCLGIRKDCTLSNGEKGGSFNSWEHCRILASKVEHFVDLLRKLRITPMLNDQEQSKHITKSLTDVVQEGGHIIDDELMRANDGAALSLGASELEGANSKVSSDKSLDSAASLDTHEVSVTTPVGITGAAAPLHINGGITPSPGRNVLRGAAASLGKNVSGAAESRGKNVFGAAASLSTHVVGASASIGTNVFSTATSLSTNELVHADKSLGNDESEGTYVAGAPASLGENVSSVAALLGTLEIGSAMSLGSIVSGVAESLCGVCANELDGVTESLFVNQLDGAAVSQCANELDGAAQPLLYPHKKKRCQLGCQFFWWKQQSAGKSKYTTAPSIEELHLSGVKIKERPTENLFGIRFEHGILKIPKLKTEDRTELILRNLVAFEQCAFITKIKNKNESAFECYISDYVGIMDQFVDTSKDVELLVKNEIVENILGGGNDALSTMINSVSTGVIYHPTNLAYDTLRINLKEFCDSGWNKNKASLRQNYFNTPWATISFCAAVILLILTVVQTICSIISLS